MPATTRLLTHAVILSIVSTPSLAQARDSTAKRAAASGTWTASIISLSGIRGAADVRISPRNDNESRARLQLRSAPINQQVAWDIVAGSCGDEGRPIAAAAAFRQILTRNDGSGDVQVNVPKLVSGQRYYVRVFAPGQVASDRAGYGCANLSESE